MTELERALELTATYDALAYQEGSLVNIMKFKSECKEKIKLYKELSDTADAVIKIREDNIARLKCKLAYLSGNTHAKVKEDE